MLFYKREFEGRQKKQTLLLPLVDEMGMTVKNSAAVYSSDHQLLTGQLCEFAAFTGRRVIQLGGC